MSSHTVFNYIIGHKEDEFLVLQNELLVSDINNKLIIITSLHLFHQKMGHFKVKKI